MITRAWRRCRVADLWRGLLVFCECVGLAFLLYVFTMVLWPPRLG